ncbi:hypothetical protein GCM10011613_24030 [Cellvibrio zantedeschiae]|uniref:Chemotaxis methyl-accepting receptor HlyB-like 4HB MCP domain-containing protein n=1 Tax=Cellvibrio zantedeschiae TaxID=1237077 RepID=A0ABQ3B3R9_9GAMM|nr:hypothetical protein [Cellvibrio zantedeschiae]GGY78541.1 hypothetical protein GCM10011613_24030 [Cellvibrio zantedeschiae]
MTKSKILLVLTYIMSVSILIVGAFSFNSINRDLEDGFAKVSIVASSPELTEQFYQKVKSGVFTSSDYLELFRKNFEAEKSVANYAKSLINMNNAMRDIIVSIGILQLLLLTLYVKYNKKT